MKTRDNPLFLRKPILICLLRRESTSLFRQSRTKTRLFFANNGFGFGIWICRFFFHLIVRRHRLIEIEIKGTSLRVATCSKQNSRRGGLEVSTTANAGSIDESPMAYKTPEGIISAIRDTVIIEKIIKPVYNFKSCS